MYLKTDDENVHFCAEHIEWQVFFVPFTARPSIGEAVGSLSMNGGCGKWVHKSTRIIQASFMLVFQSMYQMAAIMK